MALVATQDVELNEMNHTVDVKTSHGTVRFVYYPNSDPSRTVVDVAPDKKHQIWGVVYKKGKGDFSKGFSVIMMVDEDQIETDEDDEAEVKSIPTENDEPTGDNTPEDTQEEQGDEQDLRNTTEE